MPPHGSKGKVGGFKGSKGGKGSKGITGGIGNRGKQDEGEDSAPEEMDFKEYMAPIEYHATLADKVRCLTRPFRCVNHFLVHTNKYSGHLSLLFDARFFGRGDCTCFWS